MRTSRRGQAIRKSFSLPGIRDAPEVARAVLRDQLHRLTMIMRGTLSYSRNRATEPMGEWWSGDTPIPISFVELPETL